MVSSIAGGLSVATQYNLLFFQQQTSSTLIGASSASTTGGAGNSSGSQFFGAQQFSSQSLFVLIQTQQVGTSPSDDPGLYYQQGDFQNAFQNLLHGLQSGNLDTAKQAYAQISQLNSGTHNITYNNIGVPSSLQKLLYQVGLHLQANDIGGAQGVVFPVGRELPTVYQPGRFESDIQDLFRAVASDDVTAARQAFSDISRLNDGHNGITLSSIGVPTHLQSVLDVVGHNLEAFNLDGARQALSYA